MNNLHSLNGWAEKRVFIASHSAQGYFNGNANLTASSCGSSCGTSDPEPKPSACGSSCGTGEK